MSELVKLSLVLTVFFTTIN